MVRSLAQTASRKLTLKQRARVMRHNPTTSEALLWCYLKGSRPGVGLMRWPEEAAARVIAALRS